jgi:hypothetical protein
MQAWYHDKANAVDAFKLHFSASRLAIKLLLQILSPYLLLPLLVLIAYEDLPPLAPGNRVSCAQSGAEEDSPST